ncbi:MAG: hypothetical protein ABI321_00870 [Polyangia bacterium]
MATHNGLLQPVHVGVRSRGLALGIGLLLGAGALGVSEHYRTHSYLLVLDGERQEGMSYYSVFGPEPVVINHAALDGKAVVYRSDFEWVDGCTWQSVETLTPDATGYAYAYDEHLVACPDGLEPNGVPSPMTGHVSETKLPKLVAATAAYGFMLAPSP